MKKTLTELVVDEKIKTAIEQYLTDLTKCFDLPENSVTLSKDKDDQYYFLLPTTCLHHEQKTKKNAAMDDLDYSEIQEEGISKLIIKSLNPACLTLQKPIHSSEKTVFFSNPAQREKLSHIFKKVYQFELANRKKKDILISKLSGYLLICALEELECPISYLGRLYNHIHPNHKNFIHREGKWPHDDKSVSRIHYMIVDGPEGERVVLDLGSAGHTRVCYKCTINPEEYTQNEGWMNNIISKLHDRILKSDFKDLENFTSMSYFKIIRRDIALYIMASKIQTDPPKEGLRVDLITNCEKVGWSAIPSNGSYMIISGNQRCHVNNAGPILELKDNPTTNSSCSN